MTRGSDRQDALRSIGLGLFIVKQIAEAYCGQITVTSHPVCGTSFVIFLPAGRHGIFDHSSAAPKGHF